ncbi:glutamate--tRNA ligase, cytoplasmic [Senna tora]|uniref:Glutamate--tRNA ligase, cytoplasmic n=1 Tax=Senna tora TaxID=362788 RepID=A0A834WBP0_9FABA|nr:glutamate--tRNA ligase, cytoplasmic [Senna tora]
MIKKEEEDDLRLPNKEDDNKQEDIVSKDLNVRSSAHIDSEDSSGKSAELLCIADYEIPGDIPDFQTLLDEGEGFLDMLTHVRKRRDSNMHNLKRGDVLQLERKGYFKWR